MACGALATVLAVAAFLLFRFRGAARRKIRSEQPTPASVADSLAASGIGDGLMLSLVRRQNEENLKRLQVTGGHRISTASAGGDYGGGCGRNNLSAAGSSLSCSRVSIVHPLCNAAAALDDGGSSPHDKLKSAAEGDGTADPANGKNPEKTNVVAPSSPPLPPSPPPPVASARTVAVAVAVPRQQSRPTSAVAASRPVLQLCKKTLNVDNDQQQRRQQQQLRHGGPPSHQRPYAAAPLMTRSATPSVAAASGNNRNNNTPENGDDTSESPSLTVLV